MLNKSLIKNTIEKEIRNKSVIFLFVLTLIVMYLGGALTNALQVEIQESGAATFFTNTSMTVVIWIIGLSAKFVAALISANIFRSDLESGVISQLLALPIRRSSYVLNRMIGGALLSFLYLVIILIIGMIILSSNNLLPADGSIPVLGIITSLVPHLVQIIIIMFVSCFFSLFFNKIGTLLLTLFYVMASIGTFIYIQNGQPILNGVSVSSLFGIVFYVLLPRIGEVSNVSDMLTMGTQFSKDILFNILYGVLHLVVTLSCWGFIFNYIFKKRSF